MSRPIVIGLAGNPNAGKTTVFNALTGAHQHVGNYPGVTVEKKEGIATHAGRELRIIDLPGTYSLTAYSMEEIVARDFVVHEKPDVIIDVVDASNLERNLYLTTQFIELQQPTVVALNMIDVAEMSGKRIDHELLGELLGVPFVPCVAARGQGMRELLDAAIRVADENRKPALHMRFGSELDCHVDQIEAMLVASELQSDAAPRWLAIKLLENDARVREMVEKQAAGADEILAAVDSARSHIERIVGDDAEVAIADQRYGLASGAVRQAMQHDQTRRIDWSDAVDRVLVDRVLGLPIFVLFMWLMFEMVFRLGGPPMEWVEAFFGALASYASSVLPDGDLKSLIVDGIIGGVGGVLVFVPNIALLFIAISLLEDSGYMARAAFVVDKVMHHVGLHGKSFIPMLIGFGCTVPAVLATRTLDRERDRIVTMMIVSFMSCGARLPVYILLAGAFFAPHVAGKVIFSVYALGVAVAMFMALVFRSTLLKGPTTPFVMELPPYRMPTLRGVAIHVWERAWHYIKKAGTVILGFAIAMWVLMSYPKPPADMLEGLDAAHQATVALEYSAAGRMGKAIEPALRPLGFDWRIGVALIAGFGAKEVVVSTLATAYSMAEAGGETENLQAVLRRQPGLSPLVAYALMVFVLMYVPCLGTIAVIYRETGSWRWPAFAATYTTVLAWIAAFIVYNVGSLLGYQ